MEPNCSVGRHSVTNGKDDNSEFGSPADRISTRSGCDRDREGVGSSNKRVQVYR